MSERVRYVVTGLVQGVAFRAYTQRAAGELGVAGFVKNRADGSVAGEAEGDAANVRRFVDWLHQGSPWARVDDVEVTAIPAIGGNGGFAVER